MSLDAITPDDVMSFDAITPDDVMSLDAITPEDAVPLDPLTSNDTAQLDDLTPDAALPDGVTKVFKSMLLDCVDASVNEWLRIRLDISRMTSDLPSDEMR